MSASRHRCPRPGPALFVWLAPAPRSHVPEAGPSRGGDARGARAGWGGEGRPCRSARGSRAGPRASRAGGKGGGAGEMRREREGSVGHGAPGLPASRPGLAGWRPRLCWCRAPPAAGVRRGLSRSAERCGPAALPLPALPLPARLGCALGVSALPVLAGEPLGAAPPAVRGWEAPTPRPGTPARQVRLGWYRGHRHSTCTERFFLILTELQNKIRSQLWLKLSAVSATPECIEILKMGFCLFFVCADFILLVL